jgi:tRNA-Thr(GGU) m(6)t(6)A37 methyltransferase TsaA
MSMSWEMRGFTLRPIGIIRSPFRELAGTPIQPQMAGNAEGTVELFQEFVAGLRDLEGFDRIWLLYWFDRAEWEGKLIVTPYLDTAPRGLFATRAPSRPNAIGLSSVRLLSIENNQLKILGVDVLDATPVLDIKPYVPRFDCFESVRAGWLDLTTSNRTVADSRFEQKERPESGHRNE